MAEAGGSQQSQEELLLDCVQVTPEHLRSNGTIHTRACAGIAELVDNAVDSQAKNVYINTGHTEREMADKSVQKVRYIYVADDGQGMDREEALKTILVGYSLKRGDVGMIGQFGNGLKSGSMRVGETMLLCTLKNKEYTILMISLPYLETVAGNKCLVPCISYKVTAGGDMVPMKSTNEKAEKHALALKIILDWSPFQNEDDLRDFLNLNLPEEDRKSGTVVVLSDLRRLENNEYELQWTPDDMVVRRRGEDGAATEGSDDTLSGFLKNLYLEPKVIIFIHDRQVRLLDPLRSYASPRWTLLSDKGMASFVNKEKENLNKDLKKLKNEALPIEQRLAKINSLLSVKPTDKELRAEQRMKTGKLEECKKQIELLTQRLSSKGKDKPGADIRVYFGMDVERRAEPRAIFYSSGRRVLVHPLTAKGTQAFKKVMGVVCTINIPSTLLPTKQHRESFEIQAEFDVIAKKIEQHAKTYFEYIEEKYKDPRFWKDLGYDKPEFSQFDIPNLRDEEVERNIFELMGSGRRQCERCREFRPVDWEQFNEEQNVECKKFHCINTLPEENSGFPMCVPKTAAQKSAEAIKELDTRGTATSFKELEKPANAAQNSRSRNDSVVSSEDDRDASRRSCSVRRTAHNTSNGRAPSPSSPVTSPSPSRKGNFIRDKALKRNGRPANFKPNFKRKPRRASESEDEATGSVSQRSSSSSTRTRRNTGTNVSRSSSTTSKRVMQTSRTSSGALAPRRQLQKPSQTAETTSLRRSTRSKGNYVNPWSTNDEEEESEQEDEEEEEEEDDASIVAQRSVSSSVRTRRTNSSLVSSTTSNKMPRMQLSTSRSTRKNRRSISDDEGSEQEDEEEDVEEEGGEEDDAASELPSYRDDGVANGAANDGQESVSSHSTLPLDPLHSIGGSQPVLFRDLSVKREEPGETMDGDQRSTTSSHASSFSIAALTSTKPQNALGGAISGLEKKRKIEEEREKNAAVETKKLRPSLEGFKIPKRRAEEGEEEEGRERRDSAQTSRSTSRGAAMLDDTMERIYAGDYREEDADVTVITDMDHSSDLINSGPRQSMMARAERQEGLRMKTKEELIENTLVLQDVNNQLREENQQLKNDIDVADCEFAALYEETKMKEEELKKNLKEKDEEMKRVMKEYAELKKKNAVLEKEKAESDAMVAEMNNQKDESEKKLAEKDEEMTKAMGDINGDIRKLGAMTDAGGIIKMLAKLRSAPKPINMLAECVRGGEGGGQGEGPSSTVDIVDVD